ncbi:MAG: DNA methyltransferase [Phycisphaerae bacterium]|nr:DNA methyltransferase [Phycisphaerae bacterium]
MPTTIKDLVRLDPATVKLWDGNKWNQVISWQETPRPERPLEVVLRSGERIGCTNNHVWPTQRGLLRTDELQRADIIQSCRLPEPEMARDPKYIPDEVGYFIGLYIAEGSQSDGTIQIAGHIKEVKRLEWLTSFVQQYDGYIAVHNTHGNAATININSPIILGLLNTYVSGKTAKDKHLNVRCWKRNNAFLQNILQGYLDGDGHWGGERWRLGFCNNDNWVADLRTICARVGKSIRLKRTKHIMTNSGERKTFPGWRGEIRDVHKYNSAEVMAIENSRARKFWDVVLESEPHLFSLASGVLSHNSNPMPESVTDRPTKSHEYIFLLSKSAKYYCDMEGVREKYSDSYLNDTRHETGSTDRNMKDGYNDALAQNPKKLHKMFDRPVGNGRNLRDVWTIATQAFSGVFYDFDSADYVDDRGIPRKWSPDCPIHEQDGRLRRESLGVVSCDEPKDSCLNGSEHKNGRLSQVPQSSVSAKDCYKTNQDEDNLSCETLDDNARSNKDGSSPEMVSCKKSFHTTDILNEPIPSTKDCFSPSCESSAIQHNIENCKSNPVDPIAQSDTVSEVLPCHKKNSELQLSLNVPLPNNDENNKEPYISHRPIQAAGTPDHNIYISSYIKGNKAKCTCQENKTSHFATFPEELVNKCILAGTAETACGVCGKPYKRVVERTKYEPEVVDIGIRQVDESRRDKTRKLSGKEYNEQASVKTLGFVPSCEHNDNTGKCI